MTTYRLPPQSLLHIAFWASESEEADMKAGIAKRSININGHKTSVSLEDQFWSEIKAIAAERRLTVSQVVSMVDYSRGGLGNLSSTLRCFVLARYYGPAASATSQLSTAAATP